MWRQLSTVQGVQHDDRGRDGVHSDHYDVEIQEANPDAALEDWRKGGELRRTVRTERDVACRCFSPPHDSMAVWVREPW